MHFEPLLEIVCCSRSVACPVATRSATLLNKPNLRAPHTAASKTIANVKEPAAMVMYVEAFVTSSEAVDMIV